MVIKRGIQKNIAEETYVLLHNNKALINSNKKV